MGLREDRFGYRFWAVVGSCFLGFLGIGAIIPVMAPHVRQDLGQSDFTLGVIVGVFSLVALMSRFLSGPVVIRYGRKYGFMLGLGLCSIAGLIYLIPAGIHAVFAGRVVHGMGEAFLYTGAASWVVDLGGPSRRARSLAFLSTGIWGGVSFGPVVGQALGRFESAAALLVVTPVLAIAALWSIPDAPLPVPASGPRQWIPRAALLPGFALGFANIHYPTLAGFLVLHLAERSNCGGTAFAAYAFMVLTSRFFLGGLPDRLSPKVTFLGGLALMAAGLSLIALAPPAPIAIAAAALIGFGFGFPWPSMASFVLEKTADHERPSALGVMSACVDGFVGFSSMAAGAVAARFGYPSIYVMAVFAIGIAALIGQRVFEEPPEPSVERSPLLATQR